MIRASVVRCHRCKEPKTFSPARTYSVIVRKHRFRKQIVGVAKHVAGIYRSLSWREDQVWSSRRWPALVFCPLTLSRRLNCLLHRRFRPLPRRVVAMAHFRRLGMLRSLKGATARSMRCRDNSVRTEFEKWCSYAATQCFENCTPSARADRRFCVRVASISKLLILTHV